MAKKKFSIAGYLQVIEVLPSSTSAMFLLQRKRFCHNFHYVKSVQIRSFFWSVFSCIRTEYGDLLRKSLYSVKIQENADQKKLLIWTLFTQC